MADIFNQLMQQTYGAKDWDFADIADRQKNRELRDLATQKLLEEARMKAEMQPYDIASKEAQTENYLAMARGTGHYSKDKPVDPRKAVGALTDYQVVAYPQISGALAAKDPELRKTLIEEIAKGYEERGDKASATILRTGDETIIKGYFDMLNRSKPVGANQAATITGQSREKAATTAANARVASAGITAAGKGKEGAGPSKEEVARLRAMSANVNGTLNRLSKAKAEWDLSVRMGIAKGAFPQQAALDQAQQQLDQINSQLQGGTTAPKPDADGWVTINGVKVRKKAQ